MFVIGTDNALWLKSLIASDVWTGYGHPGTPEIKAVSATSPSRGRLDVFAIGTDNALWHKSAQYPVYAGVLC